AAEFPLYFNMWKQNRIVEFLAHSYYEERAERCEAAREPPRIRIPERGETLRVQSIRLQCALCGHIQRDSGQAPRVEGQVPRDDLPWRRGQSDCRTRKKHRRETHSQWVSLLHPR
ncbi:hypothetical protein PMAYCL1PPCAC_20051, partial [Pristionchus mayeri]